MKLTDSQLHSIQDAFGPNSSVYEAMTLDELRGELADYMGRAPDKTVRAWARHLLGMEGVFWDIESDRQQNPALWQEWIQAHESIVARVNAAVATIEKENG